MNFNIQVFGPHRHSDSDDGIDIIPEPHAPEPDSTSSTSPLKGCSDSQPDNLSTAIGKELMILSEYVANSKVSSTSDHREVDSAEERELLGEQPEPINQVVLAQDKELIPSSICFVSLGSITEKEVTNAPFHVKTALEKFCKVKDVIHKKLPMFIMKYFFNEYVDEEYRVPINVYNTNVNGIAEYHIVMLDKFITDIKISTNPRFVHFRNVLQGFNLSAISDQDNSKINVKELKDMKEVLNETETSADPQSHSLPTPTIPNTDTQVSVKEICNPTINTEESLDSLTEMGDSTIYVDLEAQSLISLKEICNLSDSSSTTELLASPKEICIPIIDTKESLTSPKEINKPISNTEKPHTSLAKKLTARKSCGYLPGINYLIAGRPKEEKVEVLVPKVDMSMIVDIDSETSDHSNTSILEATTSSSKMKTVKKRNQLETLRQVNEGTSVSEMSSKYKIVEANINRCIAKKDFLRKKNHLDKYGRKLFNDGRISKYTLDKKVEVMLQYKKGVSAAELTRKYNIPNSTLYQWTSIADDLLLKSRNAQKKGARYYLERKLEIISLIKAGIPVMEISRTCNLPVSTVRHWGNESDKILEEASVKLPNGGQPSTVVSTSQTKHSSPIAKHSKKISVISKLENEEQYTSPTKRSKETSSSSKSKSIPVIDAADIVPGLKPWLTKKGKNKILEEYRNGATLPELFNKYGAPPSTVNSWLLRDNIGRHKPVEPAKPVELTKPVEPAVDVKASSSSKQKLSLYKPKIKYQIIKQYRNGGSLAQLSQKYDIAPETIKAWIQRDDTQQKQLDKKTPSAKRIPLKDPSSSKSINKENSSNVTRSATPPTKHSEQSDSPSRKKGENNGIFLNIIEKSKSNGTKIDSYFSQMVPDKDDDDKPGPSKEPPVAKVEAIKPIPKLPKKHKDVYKEYEVVTDGHNRASKHKCKYCSNLFVDRKDVLEDHLSRCQVFLGQSPAPIIVPDTPNGALSNAEVQSCFINNIGDNRTTRKKCKKCHNFFQTKIETLRAHLEHCNVAEARSDTVGGLSNDDISNHYENHGDRVTRKKCKYCSNLFAPKTETLRAHLNTCPKRPSCDQLQPPPAPVETNTTLEDSNTEMSEVPTSISDVHIEFEASTDGSKSSRKKCKHCSNLFPNKIDTLRSHLRKCVKYPGSANIVESPSESSASTSRTSSTGSTQSTNGVCKASRGQSQKRPFTSDSDDSDCSYISEKSKKSSKSKMSDSSKRKKRKKGRITSITPASPKSSEIILSDDAGPSGIVKEKGPSPAPNPAPLYVDTDTEIDIEMDQATDLRVETEDVSTGLQDNDEFLALQSCLDAGYLPNSRICRSPCFQEMTIGQNHQKINNRKQLNNNFVWRCKCGKVMSVKKDSVIETFGITFIDAKSLFGMHKEGQSISEVSRKLNIPSDCVRKIYANIKKTKLMKPSLRETSLEEDPDLIILTSPPNSKQKVFEPGVIRTNIKSEPEEKEAQMFAPDPEGVRCQNKSITGGDECTEVALKFKTLCLEHDSKFQLLRNINMINHVTPTPPAPPAPPTKKATPSTPLSTTPSALPKKATNSTALTTPLTPKKAIPSTSITTPPKKAIPFISLTTPPKKATSSTPSCTTSTPISALPSPVSSTPVSAVISTTAATCTTPSFTPSTATNTSITPFTTTHPAISPSKATKPCITASTTTNLSSTPSTAIAPSTSSSTTSMAQNITDNTAERHLKENTSPNDGTNKVATKTEFSCLEDFSFQQCKTLAGYPNPDLLEKKKQLALARDIETILKIIKTKANDLTHVILHSLIVAFYEKFRGRKTTDISRFCEQMQEAQLQMSIYKLLVIHYNLVYTRVFRPIHLVNLAIEKVMQRDGHSQKKVFTLLKESYSLLTSHNELLLCRKFVHAGYHVMSLVALEAIFDQRLPILAFTKQVDLLYTYGEQCAGFTKNKESPDTAECALYGVDRTFKSYVYKIELLLSYTRLQRLTEKERWTLVKTQWESLSKTQPPREPTENTLKEDQTTAQSTDHLTSLYQSQHGTQNRSEPIEPLTDDIVQFTKSVEVIDEGSVTNVEGPQAKRTHIEGPQAIKMAHMEGPQATKRAKVEGPNTKKAQMEGPHTKRSPDKSTNPQKREHSDKKWYILTGQVPNMGTVTRRKQFSYGEFKKLETHGKLTVVLDEYQGPSNSAKPTSTPAKPLLSPPKPLTSPTRPSASPARPSPSPATIGQSSSEELIITRECKEAPLRLPPPLVMVEDEYKNEQSVNQTPNNQTPNNQTSPNQTSPNKTSSSQTSNCSREDFPEYKPYNPISTRTQHSPPKKEEIKEEDATRQPAARLSNGNSTTYTRDSRGVYSADQWLECLPLLPPLDDTPDEFTVKLNHHEDITDPTHLVQQLCLLQGLEEVNDKLLLVARKRTEEDRHLAEQIRKRVEKSEEKEALLSKRQDEIKAKRASLMNNFTGRDKKS